MQYDLVTEKFKHPVKKYIFVCEEKNLHFLNFIKYLNSPKKSILHDIRVKTI